MELTITVATVELDTQGVNFGINLTSFNPLTGAIPTRKYTSSIKLKRSKRNDFAFFAYRNPQFASKRRLNVTVRIDGIFIGEFRCVVSVEEDGYVIQLIPLDNILTEEKIELSNSLQRPYYVNKSTANEDMRYYVDVKKMIKYLFPGIRDFQAASLPDMVIRTDTEYLTDWYKEHQVIFEHYRSDEYYGEGNRLRFSDEKLMRHLNNADDQRIINFSSNNSEIAFDVRDGFPMHGATTVWLYVNGDEYKLTIKRSSDYEIYYSVPDFSIVYDDKTPLDMFITTDEGHFKFNTGNFKPIATSISGDKAICLSNNCGVDTNIDFLKSYAYISGGLIRESEGKISVNSIITEAKNWSDKYISTVSIKSASGSAEEKKIVFGEKSAVILRDPASLDKTSDLNISYPLSIKKYEMTTGIIEKSLINYLEYLSDWIIDNNYIGTIANKYSIFSDCVEYEITATLSVFDLLEFDPSKRVWIDEFSSYFYVLEISGWSTKSGNCKVKLLKLK